MRFNIQKSEEEHEILLKSSLVLSMLKIQNLKFYLLHNFHIFSSQKQLELDDDLVNFYHKHNQRWNRHATEYLNQQSHDKTCTSFWKFCITWFFALHWTWAAFQIKTRTTRISQTNANFHSCDFELSHFWIMERPRKTFDSLGETASYDGINVIYSINSPKKKLRIQSDHPT